MTRIICLATLLSISALSASAEPEALPEPPISEAQLLAQIEADAAGIKKKVELLRLKIALIAATTPR